MNILITGAAGYIAHHCVLKLVTSEHSLFGIDVISPPNISAFQKFYVNDYGNLFFCQEVFKEERIECIIHCAGSPDVRKNIADPIKFYRNDFMGTLFFLTAALENNIKKIIFLSSAQVYGDIEHFATSENTPRQPSNAYGKIKLAIEHFITALSDSHDLRYIILRIANVVGINPHATVFTSENLFSQLLLNDHLELFGNDFLTADRSAERDFIHVDDVAQAVVCSLPLLNYTPKGTCYNIASGRSHSVLNVVKAVENFSHREITIRQGDRRPGEIARLSLDVHRAQNELNWHLQYPNLDYMIASTADWLRNHGRL